MPACADQAGVAPQRAVTLSELTPHLVCPLCGGYYVDATAIVECLHTFCRSCILLHLHTTRRCPVEGCDVLVQKAQGASAANLRPDATLQSIVYKTVPGLHRDEMQRRRLFYADNQDNAAGTPSGPKATEEDQGSAFYDASDIIDLQIQYAPQRPKSQNVRAIPNPSLLRQRSAEERARDSGKGSPTAGSTAPAMSPPTIRDIHSLTRQLQEAGTSVTVTSASR
ncbi:Polycomb complex protein BMI-1-B [Amphibalanus amphitrite]|uniref:Polycomb complex protein BMI-1-B n=1 Tax=Amphibalanus amphitrite TaxID=1232801 RepID=A0A6A4WHT9_AMPAM|nr:Polycomb complex protein BMI-1-B [Amphibalanus amphitrite]